MMQIESNFYIKCNKCGCILLVEAGDLDYETSVYDRPMGDEIEYILLKLKHLKSSKIITDEEYKLYLRGEEPVEKFESRKL